LRISELGNGILFVDDIEKRALKIRVAQRYFRGLVQKQ
jgi:hypothetical protein